MQAKIKLPFDKEKRIAVVGLGISNLPLLRFLSERGYKVTARDQKGKAAFSALLPEWEALGIKTILGEGYLDDLSEDVIFRSPGIRPDLPAFRAALARGAHLTSEMELFLELTPATVLGITGSDGKTTTTTITGKLLEAECRKKGRGKVFVGGNIGEPLLPYVEEMTEEDFAVLELSSFQLQSMKRSPHRSAITNLSPNHLNWHTGMEEYVAAKTNIYLHAPCERVVLNGENERTKALGKTLSLPCTYFSSKKTSPKEFSLRTGDRAVYLKNGFLTLFDGKKERPLLEASRIRLPGIHNIENYMTALALTDGLVSRESAEEVADKFLGVRHRLELVRTLRGVAYYNSSIDSSPSRTSAALSALHTPPIVICGGYDKHIPFEPLAKALLQKAKAVVLTGATAEKIKAALEVESAACGKTIPVYFEPDFRAAVLRAHALAKPGDTVLLSPACASFDAFKNFEERGDTFCAIVRSLD